MRLATPQDQTISKLNPLNFYKRAKKSSPPPKELPAAALLNTWLGKIWKRTPSETSLLEHRTKDTVVSRSQVKKTPKVTASYAMALPPTPKLRLQRGSLDSGVQPFNSGNGDLLSPEYFVDVNLRFTNTNTTSQHSEYSGESVHLERTEGR